jgi:hypothetical protein
VSFEYGKDLVRIEWLKCVTFRDPLSPGAQHPRDAALGREQRELAYAGERIVVALGELEREVVTAYGEQLEQRLEARRGAALFPAGDHGTFATGALRELGLGEAGCSKRPTNLRVSRQTRLDALSRSKRR